MRLLPLILALTLLAAASVHVAFRASAAQEHGGETAVAAQEQQTDDDDDLVEVQLVVLGAALFVVVGLGTAGYLLRKRLGLIPPPPGPDAGGHH
jgi:hypothetical protein